MNRTWDKKLLTPESIELIKRFDKLMDRLDEAVINKYKENVK